MINFIDWIGWYGTTHRVFYTQGGGGGGGTSFSKHGTLFRYFFCMCKIFSIFFKFVIESVSSSLFSNLPRRAIPIMIYFFKILGTSFVA